MTRLDQADPLIRGRPTEPESAGTSALRFLAGYLGGHSMPRTAESAEQPDQALRQSQLPGDLRHAYRRLHARAVTVDQSRSAIGVRHESRGCGGTASARLTNAMGSVIALVSFHAPGLTRRATRARP